jgi:hypothetical protein
MASGPSLANPNDPRWSEVNREKAAYRREVALSMSPAERVELGLELSRQAAEVVESVARTGHAHWLSGRS